MQCSLFRYKRGVFLMCPNHQTLQCETVNVSFNKFAIRIRLLRQHRLTHRTNNKIDTNNSMHTSRHHEKNDICNLKHI